MYSQNDEERVILEFFGGHIGTCLDIGAHDGIEFSNTRQLIVNGWRAMLVEPNPQTFCRLIDLYKQNANVALVNAAVCGVTGFDKMHLDTRREWAATISEECASAQVDTAATFWTYTITPDKLDTLRGDMAWPRFDFVSIDAEWSDAAIVEGGDSILSAARLVCVEKGPDDWPPLLAKHGFTRKIHNTPENLIYAKP